MSAERIRLHDRIDPRFEEIKRQIACAIEKEVKLLAEERRERAKQLGLSENMVGD